MGGINSGRRRTVTRGAVEQFPCIDLRILKRAGLINAGECTYDILHWRNQAPETVSAQIFIDISDIDDASIRFVMSGADGRRDVQRAALKCVPCPYGGYRVYFLCPIIGVRCEQLFLVDGIFASRKAHRLTYASQSEDDLSRARRKARKFNRQIDGDYRFARPRGAKRWRLIQKRRDAVFEAKSLYLDRLRNLADRSGTRRMPSADL
ncbi:hypothetical protein [Pseudonocardia sp. TMWB2A]|uniref:hypothetical protein n=1 Tax=Pseudonocardia sp. TMWB2A TaxID=687430 RepID=UPI00307EB47C